MKRMYKMKRDEDNKRLVSFIVAMSILVIIGITLCVIFKP